MATEFYEILQQAFRKSALVWSKIGPRH